MKQSGADILRLWVVASDYAEDLRIGPEILKHQGDAYRRLRNTLRYLLGALAGFSPDETVPAAEMPELERWVLHRLAELDGTVRQRDRRLRFPRHVHRAAQFLRRGFVGVLFRHPQGPALLRCAPTTRRGARRGP